MKLPLLLITAASAVAFTACSPKQKPTTNTTADAANTAADTANTTAAAEMAHSASNEGSAVAVEGTKATPVAMKAGASTGSLPVLGAEPSWKLKDLNGNEVSSDQLKGKVVVLDFWATWCPPCREEIPGYVDLYRKYQKQGLVIVGASVDQAGPKVVKEFVQKYGVSYPVVMADDAVVSAFGGVDSIPTTFLIDRDGKIRDKKIGAMPTDEYEKKIQAVLQP